MKHLWILWLSICSLVLISCSSEIKDREAPEIATALVDPFVYYSQADSLALDARFSDNESPTVASLFTCTYFDLTQTDLKKDSFFFAFAQEITRPEVQTFTVDAQPTKPGFYWLEIQAGDNQGNASSANQLVYFDAVNNPFNQEKLVPFSQENETPFWNFFKTDSLLLKKFELSDTDSLTAISIYSLPYNTGNTLPQQLATKAFNPAATLRLDTLGYFNFTTTLDTAHLIVVASDKLGNPLSYSHPVVFGN